MVPYEVGMPLVALLGSVVFPPAGIFKVSVFFQQEEVMVLERILLQTIKFDLQVEHPYMFLLRYVKQLKGQMG